MAEQESVHCREESVLASNDESFGTTSVVSFSIAEVDCREVGAILDQSFGIQVRAGLHCAPLVHETLGTLAGGGTVRLSPGPFTTEAEVSALLDAVQQIAETMSLA